MTMLQPLSRRDACVQAPRDERHPPASRAREFLRRHLVVITMAASLLAALVTMTAWTRR